MKIRINTTESYTTDIEKDRKLFKNVTKNTRGQDKGNKYGRYDELCIENPCKVVLDYPPKKYLGNNDQDAAKEILFVFKMYIYLD